MAPTPLSFDLDIDLDIDLDLDLDPGAVSEMTHYIPKRAVAEVFRINPTQRQVRTDGGGEKRRLMLNRVTLIVAASYVVAIGLCELL